jgi:hypothetical protein
VIVELTSRVGGRGSRDKVRRVSSISVAWSHFAAKVAYRVSVSAAVGMEFRVHTRFLSDQTSFIFMNTTMDLDECKS